MLVTTSVLYTYVGGDKDDLFGETSDIEKEQRLYAGVPGRKTRCIKTGCCKVGVRADLSRHFKSYPDK